MTQEEKSLLLKDLCARLPYGVKIYYNNKIYSLSIPYLEDIKNIVLGHEYSRGYNIKNISIKPYLRPMSSMTEEEKEELAIIRSKDFQLVRQWIKNESIKETGVPCPVTCGEIDYCNKKHFDYRGLIEKNLALEVTEENNPYKE